MVLVAKNVADLVDAPRPGKAKFHTLSVEQLNNFKRNKILQNV